jgi:hypothetical protein
MTGLPKLLFLREIYQLLGLIAYILGRRGCCIGSKKKYPEPYRREDSKIFYFVYTGIDDKRHKQSTGESA